MKKLFCDCCGDEMVYGDRLTETSRGGMVDKSVLLDGKEATAKFKVEISIDLFAKPNGSHLDVCGSCRWSMIDKLDARSKAMIDKVDANVFATIFRAQVETAAGGDLDWLGQQVKIWRGPGMADVVYRERILWELK